MGLGFTRNQLIYSILSTTWKYIDLLFTWNLWWFCTSHPEFKDAEMALAKFLDDSAMRVRIMGVVTCHLLCVCAAGFYCWWSSLVFGTASNLKFTSINVYALLLSWQGCNSCGRCHAQSCNSYERAGYPPLCEALCSCGISHGGFPHLQHPVAMGYDIYSCWIIK